MDILEWCNNNLREHCKDTHDSTSKINKNDLSLLRKLCRESFKDSSVSHETVLANCYEIKTLEDLCAQCGNDEIKNLKQEMLGEDDGLSE